MTSDLTSEEQSIVSVLCQKFNPEAIILVGSRVDGSATADSDWDVFLFCGEWRLDEQVQTEDMNIDVNFAAWPAAGQYLDAGFGPVHPVKVLFDQSNGKLAILLENTNIAYEKGPLELQASEHAYHLRALNRNIEKLRKHRTNSEVLFYYKSGFYKLFLQTWFEKRNKWSPSPTHALKIVETSQPEVFKLLETFIESSKENAAEIAERLSKSL